MRKQILVCFFISISTCLVQVDSFIISVQPVRMYCNYAAHTLKIFAILSFFETILKKQPSDIELIRALASLGMFKSRQSQLDRSPSSKPKLQRKKINLGQNQKSNFTSLCIQRLATHIMVVKVFSRQNI